MIEELRALADQMDDFGTQPWRGLLLAIVEKYEGDFPPTISDDEDWNTFWLPAGEPINLKETGDE